MKTLIGKAQQCRRLAAGVDLQTADALLAMAKECEAEAAQLENQSPNEMPPAT